MEPVIPRVPVVSSSIEAIGYVPSTQVLEVVFRRGTVYRYVSVPDRVYANFLAAPSKGRYFAAHVRDRFEYVRA